MSRNEQLKSHTSFRRCRRSVYNGKIITSCIQRLHFKLGQLLLSIGSQNFSQSNPVLTSIPKHYYFSYDGYQTISFLLQSFGSTSLFAVAFPSCMLKVAIKQAQRWVRKYFPLKFLGFNFKIHNNCRQCSKTFIYFGHCTRLTFYTNFTHVSFFSSLTLYVNFNVLAIFAGNSVDNRATFTQYSCSRLRCGQWGVAIVKTLYTLSLIIPCYSIISLLNITRLWPSNQHFPTCSPSCPCSPLAPCFPLLPYTDKTDTQ